VPLAPTLQSGQPSPSRPPSVNNLRLARSASAALLLVARASPDVVLLDITMAGVDGMTALRRIRARHPTLPVIMLTANDDVDVARDTLKLGAFDYVAKPFNFGHLARVIEAAMEHRGHEGSTALS
jgi:DNA-binding NtrC family response regulator